MSFAQYTRREEPHFSNVYMNAKPDEQYKKKVHYLLIDNRDRENSSDSPYSFVINLDNVGRGRYENVLSVQLKTLVFPKILNETYVIVDIPEFSDNIHSSDNGAHRSFAVAFFDGVDAPVDPPLAPGDRKPIKANDCHPQIKVFNPVLTSLSRLRVNFRKHGGALVTPADVGNVEDVNFLLEITCLEKNVA